MIGEIEEHNWMYDTRVRARTRTLLFIFTPNMKEW